MVLFDLDETLFNSGMSVFLSRSSTPSTLDSKRRHGGGNCHEPYLSTRLDPSAPIGAGGSKRSDALREVCCSLMRHRYN